MPRKPGLGGRLISAAILCSAAPGRVEGSGIDLAIGGPIHPVSPEVYVPRFPHRLALAVHVRVWLAAQASLSVSLRDERRGVIPWEVLGPEPVQTRLPAASSLAARYPEEAVNINLPAVIVRAPQRLFVAVEVWGVPTGQRALDRIHLPLEVLASRQPDQGKADERSPRLLDAQSELQALLPPAALRALRSAALEARRLGHRHVGSAHLVLACRRAAGGASHLPPTPRLRDALEQIEGLGLTAPSLGEMWLTPLANEVLRGSATTPEGLASPEGLLAQLANRGGTHLYMVELARRRARRRSG
jgi:hypothetical protein